MSKHRTSVLMVCLGNVCRSPTAEAAFREAAEQAGLDVEVDSAGTGAYHVGERPDARMRAAAAEDGLDVDGSARQVDVGDFERFDLLVAMDGDNAADLCRLAPDRAAADRVHLLRDFGGAPGASVPDPYYGGPDGFREVVEICQRGAAGLVAAIQRGEV